MQQIQQEAQQETPTGAQRLNVEQVAGSLGGKVRGFSLKRLSDDDFAQVAQALWTYQVLIFKDQHLPIDDYIALGKRFGPLHTHPAANGVNDHPEVLLLRNTGKAKNITEVWHSDVSCEQQPPSISILQAIEVPAYGGDTMWANQYAALDRLSAGMRAMLEPLRAVHNNFGLEAIHPVLRTHPETGRKALYVNRGFTKRFEGMTEAESAPLLKFLVDAGSQPDLTMRHRWEAGDVVFWDNRCVMHYAVHDYDNAPREMHRVTVQGEVPV